MGDSLLATVIQWTIWGIVMVIVIGWLARSRLRQRPRSESRKLVHPQSTLITGVVLFPLFVGFMIFSFVVTEGTTRVLLTLLWVVFAALPLPLIADYIFARHEVSEEGMDFGRITGRRGTLEWADVVRVEYAPRMGWFRIETGSGEVARVTIMLMGLPEFARLVLARVPEQAIEANALPVLRATAAGKPPNIWV